MGSTIPPLAWDEEEAESDEEGVAYFFRTVEVFNMLPNENDCILFKHNHLTLFAGNVSTPCSKRQITQRYQEVVTALSDTKIRLASAISTGNIDEVSAFLTLMGV